ncbi:MAG: tRNA pseudouridine(55) synthase TruB, partial [Solimonas sp.]
LDPLATGMLPVCLGEATKLSSVLLESDKRYVARVRLGEQTSTGDAEGEVIARSDPAAVTPGMLLDAARAFVGPLRQVPPMYSALKRDGRPLYELAREGQTVEREARDITVAELQVQGFAGNEFEFDVRCSKGTYVRTLAEDLAAAVGQKAHLVGLRRVGVAPFWRQPMVTLEALQAAADDLEALDRHLLGCAEALRHWPSVTVNDVRAHALAHGRAQRIPGLPRDARLAVLDGAGALLGLAQSDGDGWLQPQRWLQGLDGG